MAAAAGVTADMAWDTARLGHSVVGGGLGRPGGLGAAGPDMSGPIRVMRLHGPGRFLRRYKEGDVGPALDAAVVGCVWTYPA